MPDTISKSESVKRRCKEVIVGLGVVGVSRYWRQREDGNIISQSKITSSALGDYRHALGIKKYPRS